MVVIEIIGNLGADVKRVDYNGAVFYSINVCDNRKVGDREETVWYTCNLNNPKEELLKYLVKGQMVQVKGVPRYRIFDSAKAHTKMVGVEVFVNQINLVGVSPQVAMMKPLVNLVNKVNEKGPETIEELGQAFWDTLHEMGVYAYIDERKAQASSASGQQAASGQAAPMQESQSEGFVTEEKTKKKGQTNK